MKRSATARTRRYGETELLRISAALMDALHEAYGLAQAGEYGEPLREVLVFAGDLVALADETLAADPQAGEHARGLAMHMAEQLAELEAVLTTEAQK